MAAALGAQASDATLGEEEESDLSAKLPTTELGFRPLRLPDEAAEFFGDLALDEDMATLEILPGEGDAVEALRCHASVLALRSTEIMHELLLSEEPPTPDEPLVLEFPEDDLEHWEAAIHWAYTNEITFSIDTANELRAFAELRGFTGMAQQLEEFISAAMRADSRSAFTVATKALESGDKTMLRIAFDAAFAVPNAIASAAVRTLPPKGFLTFISDDRAASSELLVFRAAVEWAETLMRALERRGKQFDSFESAGPAAAAAAAAGSALTDSDTDGDMASDSDSTPRRARRGSGSGSTRVKLAAASSGRLRKGSGRAFGRDPPKGAAAAAAGHGGGRRALAFAPPPEADASTRGGFDVKGVDITPLRQRYSGAAIRSAMGEEVMREIRFPLMHPAELALVVAPSGLLTDEELAELLCTTILRQQQSQDEAKARIRTMQRRAELAAIGLARGGPGAAAGAAAAGAAAAGAAAAGAAGAAAAAAADAGAGLGGVRLAVPAPDASTAIRSLFGSSTSGVLSRATGEHLPPRVAGPDEPIVTSDDDTDSDSEVELGDELGSDEEPDPDSEDESDGSADACSSDGGSVEEPSSSDTDSDTDTDTVRSSAKHPEAVPADSAAGGAASLAESEADALARLGPAGKDDPVPVKSVKLWAQQAKQKERLLNKLERRLERREAREAKEEAAKAAGVDAAALAEKEKADTRRRICGFLDVTRLCAVPSYDVIMWGGGGASGKHDPSGTGGAGGYLHVRVPMVPGDAMKLHVGQGGEASGDSGFTKLAYPNGGRGAWDHRGGGGGGASYITLSKFGKAVAAGAGGGGGGVSDRKWAGGGGGGGGSCAGKLGSGGDGLKHQSAEDTLGVDGNGNGGKNSSTGSGAAGASPHGAGGKGGATSSADGGGGGDMSAAHATVVLSIPATSHTAVACPTTGLTHGGGASRGNQASGDDGCIIVMDRARKQQVVLKFDASAKVRSLTATVSGWVLTTDSDD